MPKTKTKTKIKTKTRTPAAKRKPARRTPEAVSLSEMTTEEVWKAYQRTDTQEIRKFLIEQ